MNHQGHNGPPSHRGHHLGWEPESQNHHRPPIDHGEKPKLKFLGFTYNGAKLFNMLPIKIKQMEDPNTFKTMTKDWIWDNIPSY